MKLFNTLTRRKEEFVPLEEGKQPDPYRKCTSDDYLRYRTPIYGIQRI